MGLSSTHKRKALRIGLLLVGLLVVGCSGMKPYEPHDYRREGPKQGLFSGSKGEFVIYREVDDPVNGGEAGKGSDESAEGEKQEMGSKEKKEETK
jgi:hypothetical protein